MQKLHWFPQNQGGNLAFPRGNPYCYSKEQHLLNRTISVTICPHLTSGAVEFSLQLFRSVVFSKSEFPNKLFFVHVLHVKPRKIY